MFAWSKIVSRMTILHRPIIRYHGRTEWMSVAALGVLSLTGVAATCEQQEQQPQAQKNSATVPTDDIPISMQASSAASTSSFRIDQIYDIQQVLGEGAYGMVYKARRKRDGAVVALKTMSRSLTGQTDFEREVAALQLLSKPPGHANIVQLYDLHRDDHNYYLVMELIEGGELLEHLIEHGPYSEGLAASFLRQFAEAMVFVHNNNLCHADLKPENLLLSTSQELKLADFGAARTHDLSRHELRLPAHEFAMGCSFLHMVALGNQFELEKMLQDRPELVNFRDYDFRTPLHLAASEGHVDICRFLIQRGARVNRSDRWGGSPLDDAHRQRHTEVMDYLYSQGATFGAVTQLPRFIQAASDGNIQEVEALLEFGSIDLDQGDYDKRTALHLAAGEGRIEVVEVLCRAGADVNVEDRWGNRPMDDAKNAKKNSEGILSLLVNYGAKSVKDPSLNHQALSNSTPATRTTRKKEATEFFSGTIAYWPPELFADGAAPTPASDMWAAGVIMYVLLTGSHPFDRCAELDDDAIQQVILKVAPDQENHMQVLNEIVFDDRVEGLSRSCIELMRLLIHPDPQKRINSEQYLRHPWIQGLTAPWTMMGKAHMELKAFWQNKFRTEIIQKFADSLGISQEELSDRHVEEIFHNLDIKKNGVLEPDEIQTTFRELGISEKNIQSIFAAIDLDGSGVIRFDEFRALLLDKGTSDLHVNYLQKRFKSHILNRFVGTLNEMTPDEKQLREIFNSIDQDGDGVLDPHDIRVVLRSAGEPEDVISKIAASMDLNQTGKVSWDDFRRVMGAKVGG